MYCRCFTCMTNTCINMVFVLNCHVCRSFFDFLIFIKNPCCGSRVNFWKKMWWWKMSDLYVSLITHHCHKPVDILIVYEVINLIFAFDNFSDCWFHSLKAKSPYGRVTYMQYSCWLRHVYKHWSWLNILTACSWLVFGSELLLFLQYIARWETSLVSNVTCWVTEEAVWIGNWFY